MIARVIDRDSLFSLIAGPLVWVGHFLIVYLTAAIACAKGGFDLTVSGMGLVPLVTAAATVIAAVLIVDGAVLAHRRWRGPQSEAPESSAPDRNDSESRRRFMAHAGLLLYALSLVATLWEALPVWFITSCR